MRFLCKHIKVISGIYLLLLIILINLPGRQPDSYWIFIAGIVIYALFWVYIYQHNRKLKQKQNLEKKTMDN